MKNLNIYYAFRDREHFDPHIYHRTLLLLEEIFSAHDLQLREVRKLSTRIRDALDAISPVIQQTTGQVCPHCTSVCCISKHGFYNYEDLVYLLALGLRPPSVDFGRNDNDPCQFLTREGCSMKRSLRPSGCNWYFCDSLLDVIETSPNHREFDDSMRDLAELWMKMIDKFSSISPLPFS